ncbi:MAG: hypothetical protein HQ523_03955 [Lentisphaerae bacterium]|nr:hypothetical protein [Lentisphaerota bacterium]
MRKVLVLLTGVLLSAGICYAQDIPNLTTENLAAKTAIAETFGSVRAEGISIGIDSAGLAHVASDFGFFGNTLYMSHRIGANQWTQAQMPEHSVANNAHRPQLKIDKQDRLWVISHYFTAGNLQVSGTGLWTVNNVLNDLTLIMLPEQHIGPQDGWINGSLGVDDTLPGRCYIYTGDGYGRAVGTSGENLGEQYLQIGQSGEQHDYDLAQRAGGAVTHGCQAGSPSNPSSYNNSARTGSPIVWAHYPTYNLGPDEIHPGVVGDSENPEIGYIACVWDQGFVMNIWNPANGGLQRPTTSLITIDANAFHLYRKVPRMAAAKGGGVWVAWTRANRVKLQFITQVGVQGPEIDVGPGAWPDVTVDADGNLHLAYGQANQNVMNYLKINVGTGGGDDILMMVIPALQSNP